jgi:hypothetical protein
MQINQLDAVTVTMWLLQIEIMNIEVSKLSLSGPHQPTSPHVLFSACSIGCGGARSLRNEPQYEHVSATTKHKIHEPLIGFLH